MLQLRYAEVVECRSYSVGGHHVGGFLSEGLQCGLVAVVASVVWASCGVGGSRCKWVAILRSCSMGELMCGRVTEWGSCGTEEMWHGEVAVCG